MNGVRFVISEGENFASGPDSASVTQSFVFQKFHYSEKGTEKISDIDIRRGQSVPLTSLIMALYTFTRLPHMVLVKKEKHVLEQDTLLLYNH